MNLQRITRRSLLACSLLACALGARAEDRAPPEPVHIRLRESAATRSQIVSLGEIATLTGGPAATRARMASLDVAELKTEQSREVVSRTRIQARLLLAGVSQESFVIDGAPVATVTSGTPRGSSDQVLESIRLAVANRMSLPESRFVIAFTQPLPAGLLGTLADRPGAQLDVRLPTTPCGGRTRVDLWLTGPGLAESSTPIVVDLRFRQTVPLVTRTVPAGEVLSADAISFEEREVTQCSAVLVSEDIVGRKTRRTLTAGEILSPRDLGQVAAPEEPVLVKPRDLVRVTARKGGLKVVISAAEALQPGRQGEVIRVKNSSSGRIFTGRVVAAGELEVPL